MKLLRKIVYETDIRRGKGKKQFIAKNSSREQSLKRIAQFMAKVISTYMDYSGRPRDAK